jgi:uncharacterized GH25 family protein
MKTLLALILLAIPSVAAAHDFWLEPSTYRPAPNTAVSIRLRVGQDYEGDPVPRPEALLVFDAFTAEGKNPVEGDTGEEPAGVVTVKNRGLLLVAYHNSPGYVELTEDKLRQYLRDEGLERLADDRKRSPYANQPWRELFSRCAKTLLWTGSGPATVFNKRVGMPLELIPEKNPYALHGGGTLPVQLLYRGKPLAGALFVITPKADPSRKLAVRSDANGRVRVKLDAPGEWMIKAVHIVPAAPGGRAQWESFWASLTFELPE